MREDADAVDTLLDALLGGEGWSVSKLASMPEDQIRHLTHRVLDRREWANAAEDLITIVLQTHFISDEEDLLRLEIL